MNRLSFRSQNQRKKSLKYGGYATVSTLVVLVALILINVLFAELDLTIDLTKEELYTPGEQTMEILNSLEDDIVIYGLYNTGTETNDLNAKVILLVNEYCDLSKHLSFKTIDPLKDPTFANKFLMDDSESFANGTLIVENQATGKFKTLPLNNLYEVTTDYQYLTRTVTGFSAEEALSTAIQYVSMTQTPVLYQLQGHSETLLSDGFLDYLSYSNYDTKELNLVTENINELEANVATVVLVNNPRQDLSEGEYQTLLNYMENGGRMLYLASYDSPELPNFSRLLSRYGLGVQPGLMVETDENYYYQYPQMILPILSTDSEITSYMLNDSNNYALMVLPASITVSDQISSRIKIDSLVTTSAGAIIKQGTNEAVVYEEGDIQGPFNLVVAAEEEKTVNNQNVTSKLVVVGNSEYINTYATTGNYKLTTIICDYLQDTGDQLYISTKSLEEGMIETSNMDFVVWGLVFIVLVPAIIIIAGIVTYSRRKHR